MSIRTLIVAALPLVCLGCSDSGSSAPPDYGGEDGLAIARLVEGMSEDKTSQRRYGKLLAAGTKIPPADAKKLPKYTYDVAGKPAVAGDAATATVAIRPEAGGAEPGPKEWAFVREAGAWKIKAAPLP